MIVILFHLVRHLGYIYKRDGHLGGVHHVKFAMLRAIVLAACMTVQGTCCIFQFLGGHWKRFIVRVVCVNVLVV